MLQLTHQNTLGFVFFGFFLWWNHSIEMGAMYTYAQTYS